MENLSQVAYAERFKYTVELKLRVHAAKYVPNYLLATFIHHSC